MSSFPLSDVRLIIGDIPPPPYSPTQRSVSGWVLFAAFWALFALACVGLRKLFRRRAPKEETKREDATVE